MNALAHHFALFVPTLPHLAALGSVLLVALAMVLVGAAIGGRQRLDEGLLVYGWAAAGLLFTVVGVATRLPFTWIALIFAVAAAIALGRAAARDRRVCDASLLRMIVLAAPLLLLAGNMSPSQWDEFTQWLPNARFLVEHDSFPRADLPRSPSVFPAYPHGLAVAIYMASRIAGFLVENAGGIFNLLLLLSAGLLAARVIRMALARPDADTPVKTGLAGPNAAGAGWGFCALGALAVTALNPGFVQKIVLTAYGDSATAVTLGFTAALGWMLLNAIAEGAPDRARAMAWQMGLAATALLNIKQVNLVLFACVLAGMGLVALRDPKVPVAELLRHWARLLLLPLAVYAAWRIHVALNITGGEFSLKPLAEWHLDLVPHLLGKMVVILAKKGAYLALMLAAVGFALRALWRPRDEFDRLAVIVATAFLGYNAFLALAYTASFSEYEARAAASFWRYNTHLGTVGVLFGAYGLAMLWRRRMTPRARPRLAWLAVALIVVLPVALAQKLRFDAEKRYVYVRDVGAALNGRLTPQDRLLAVDARDNGQYLVIIRYAMHGSAKVTGEISAFSRPLEEALRRSLNADPPPTHVWVHAPVPEVTRVLGLQLAPGSSYLLARRNGGWHVAASWPHPESGE